MCEFSPAVVSQGENQCKRKVRQIFEPWIEKRTVVQVGVLGTVLNDLERKLRGLETNRTTDVTYWSSTEPSIKRCTCVNKRKNSGSRWMWDNYITRCPRRVEPVGVSWGQDAKLRASGRQRALGAQWPTVEQLQSRWERSAAMVRRTLGQYSSLSPSPAHLTQPTSTLSRIKCERLYSYKEVYSFVHWSSSLLLTMFRIYIQTPWQIMH